MLGKYMDVSKTTRWFSHRKKPHDDNNIVAKIHNEQRKAKDVEENEWVEASEEYQ